MNRDIIKCKDCIHRPKLVKKVQSDGSIYEYYEFPDIICVGYVDDDWYQWIPDEDFFCGYGERAIGESPHVRRRYSEEYLEYLEKVKRGEEDLFDYDGCYYKGGKTNEAD